MAASVSGSRRRTAAGLTCNAHRFLPLSASGPISLGNSLCARTRPVRQSSATIKLGPEPWLPFVLDGGEQPPVEAHEVRGAPAEEAPLLDRSRGQVETKERPRANRRAVVGECVPERVIADSHPAGVRGRAQRRSNTAGRHLRVRIVGRDQDGSRHRGRDRDEDHGGPEAVGYRFMICHTGRDIHPAPELQGKPSVRNGRGVRRSVRMRVLIVDDHEPFRAVAREVLERAGHVVAGEAGDAAEALAAVAAGSPDAVLLDVQLPDRDGFSVAAELAARTGRRSC